MRSAVTISLVPEARGGPFVFWDGIAAGCANAASLGFDAIEIYPSSAEELDVGDIVHRLAAHGLRCAAMGTGAGWVKHRLRLTDPDADLRRKALGFATRIVEAAGTLGAPAIVGSMQGRSGDGATREQTLGWLAEALAALAEGAARHGVPLLYEPLNRDDTNLFNRQAEAAEFLGAMGLGNVMLLCDLFHMSIEETDIADALRAAGPLVGHVHFADSNRLAMGWGNTDMAPIMAALREIGYAGYLSAEILPLPDSVSAARQTMLSFRRWTTV